MKLSRFLHESHVSLNLEADNERDLLADALDAAPDEIFDGTTRADVFAAILAREARGATVLGVQTFLPHARVEGLASPFLLFATVAEPIEVTGLDHATSSVRAAFILCVPAARNTFMLQAMAAIARLISYPEAETALLGIKSAGRIIRHIEELAVDIKNVLLTADVMETEPPALAPHMKLAEAVRFLVECGAESMAVVGAEGELMGELGTREVLAFAIPKFLGLLTDTSEVVNFEAFAKFFENETTTLVSEIMETDPITVTPETGVMDAAHRLLESGRSKAYVTNPNHILLGDLSRLSLLHRVFAA